MDKPERVHKMGDYNYEARVDTELNARQRCLETYTKTVVPESGATIDRRMTGADLQNLAACVAEAENAPTPPPVYDFDARRRLFEREMYNYLRGAATSGHKSIGFDFSSVRQRFPDGLTYGRAYLNKMRLPFDDSGDMLIVHLRMQN